MKTAFELQKKGQNQKDWVSKPLDSKFQEQKFSPHPCEQPPKKAPNRSKKSLARFPVPTGPLNSGPLPCLQAATPVGATVVAKDDIRHVE